MNIAFVGCSYTHWHYYNVKNYNFPALFAKEHPQHNVYDLSVCGSSNDSIYFRLYYAQKHYGVKFDKVIVQMTHFARTLHWYNTWEFDWQTPIGNQKLAYSNNNYTSIGDKFSRHFDTITSGLIFAENRWQSKLLMKVMKTTGMKANQIQKFFVNQFDGHKYIWECQKELDTVNGVYDKENVIIFSWHDPFDSETTKHHDILVPCNYIGSVQKTFGEKFYHNDYAVDDSPHYNATGHKAVYEWLLPHIINMIEK